MTWEYLLLERDTQDERKVRGRIYSSWHMVVSLGSELECGDEREELERAINICLCSCCDFFLSWVMSFDCHLWKAFCSFLLRIRTERAEIERLCCKSLLSTNNWVVLPFCFACASSLWFMGVVSYIKFLSRSGWGIQHSGRNKHRIQGYF